jgi:retrograde regulation protein 2
LYDAQWQTGQKAAIPDATIYRILLAMRRFKRTCNSFGVPSNQIKILATEATRQAINSAEFREAIKKETGWEVTMLPKEEEGRIGAMGVVSSFPQVRGLMMDLGGGSTQLTWIETTDGELRMSEAGSFSMPYGAAALSRRLKEAQEKGGGALNDLRDEITDQLKEAVAAICIPEAMKAQSLSGEGLPLYVSGGGYRGWGFICMSQHTINPYPIPIINGFQISIAGFQNINLITSAAAATEEESVFRVSDRRAKQISAVALLVGCLPFALPAISTVHFAQGGVREGALFDLLSKEIRAQHPLESFTRQYATESALGLTNLLLSAAPAGRSQSAIDHNLLRALAQSMYLHGHYNKDLQATAAVRSTTSGRLASVHGADHAERAILAIMLCQHWGGASALSPADATFYHSLVSILDPIQAWWAVYFGRVGALVREVYPAGVIDEPLLNIASTWDSGKSKQKLKVVVTLTDDEDAVSGSAGLLKALQRIEKLGKSKQWPGNEGYKVDLYAKGPNREIDIREEVLADE